MKEVGLTIVAIVIYIMVAPIGIMWQILFRRNWKDYFYNLSISIDQIGNVTCSSFFNSTLISKEGYKFGNPDETISSVLGKNELSNTLLFTGKLLTKFLNKIDKEHTKNSIDLTEK